MRPFKEASVADVDPQLLRRSMDCDGYLLVRNVLPTQDIRQLLQQVTAILTNAGWLRCGADPMDRWARVDAACGDPDAEFKRVYQQVFNLESFHALPHHRGLRRVMTMLTGERLLVHPKPIGRLIFPHCDRLTVRAHQDYRFMSGDPECFTAWIPLHDCPIEMGPLRIMEGSHLMGFQQHDEDGLHVPEIPQRAIGGGAWVGGQINAGDVLLFHSLTVHAAAPNLSQQLRISLDCRFQDYQRALHPANLAFAGESGKSWEKTYRSWKSDHLKYYWRNLPLELKPSRNEIEHIALTDSSPAVRARYDRILGQI